MPDTQWGRPAGCYTGCRDEFNQGRLPCPHRAEDVAAMREMGVDLRPLPVAEPDPLTLRSLGLALLIAGMAIVASFFAPWGFALPL